MSMSSAIGKVRWHTVQISPKTNWSFVEIFDAQGRAGVGEATLAQHELEMAQVFAAYRTAWTGRLPDDVDLTEARSSAVTLAEFAVLSAFDQAAGDLAAQQRNASVSDVLGGRRRDRIPLYANINRGTADRTPEGFAARARRAVADGF